MDKTLNSVELIEYSTLDLDARDQFDAWSQMVAPVCDLKSARSTDSGFRARLSGYDLNGIGVISWESDPGICERTNEHIRRTDLDSWAIWFIRKGNLFVEMNGQTVKRQPGDLMVLSHDRPWKACWQQGFVSMHLNRDKFAWLAPALDNVNHALLTSPLGGLLATFISTLVDDAHRISEEQTRLLSKSFSNLLAASVAPTVDNLYNAKPALNASKLAIARNFIHKHLDRPELNADFICKSLGMSRRSLYSIFEERGGVAKYIKTSRLEACYQALSDNTDLRLVSTVAYQYGFTNMALFSRQFKEQYGFSPKETREQNLFDRVEPSVRPMTPLDRLSGFYSSS